MIFCDSLILPVSTWQVLFQVSQETFESYKWREKWQHTPVFLPGEFFGRKGLVGYSSRGRRELGRTERLTHIDCYKGMLKSVK